eukprot:TRINITY_DN50026_c0_g1_i1.p1 TRINITY_DN50026_c0_g1~~TRINITY_DN50026_c0_g1_i1.p1  ORF type:complete len:1021 (+),score=200.22 TRINITY_DN50026_c0_g1_i1:41-3103(+)
MGCWVVMSTFVAPLFLFVFLIMRLPCCPKRAKQKIGTWWFRMVLPFRYDIRVSGLKALPADQGILFLPNHPALMDPLILISYLSRRFRIKPVAAEQQYQRNAKLFALFDTFPVPDFEEGANSYQKHLMDGLLDSILEALEGGEKILLYPAGRLMRSGKPFIEVGSSATFDIISRRSMQKPWRVVLVSTHGLWGSRFSYAYNLRKLPNFFSELKGGLCDLLCSMLWFMPKRVVDIHMEEVTLPTFKDKLEFNDWLAKWYDQYGSESLVRPGDESYVRGKGLVPRRCCKPQSVKEPDSGSAVKTASADHSFDPKLVATVQSKLAKHLGVSQDKLGLDQSLSFDLGLDSIQTGELLGWLDDEFDVNDVQVTELSDVASLVRVIDSGGGGSSAGPQARAPPKEWLASHQGRPAPLAEIMGKNLPEAFLWNAKRMGSQIAVGDDTSGALPYDRVLIGAMLFANFLLAHPEKCAGGRIGLMMPAAAGVGVAVLGIMMAGCTPVMVNWTVGRASLEHVVTSTGIRTVITAKAFLKKLGPEVDLSCLLKKEGLLLFTEDLKANTFGGFGLLDKLAAKRASGKSVQKLIAKYKLNERSPESEAVVLFTSGSESFPKGVPLSHSNVMANIKGIMGAAEQRSSDIILGTLPPFHSFGFAVTTMLPLVTGVKTAYYPNPTEYRRIAREMNRWKPTLYLGTPTFVMGVLKAAEADRKKGAAPKVKAAWSSSGKVVPTDSTADPPWPTASLRICITGAEKTPDDLFALAQTHTPELSVLEGYGITETSPVLTVNRLGKARSGVGQPLDGISLALLDTEEYLVKKAKCISKLSNGSVDGAIGTTGVIAAAGPNVFGAPDANPPRGYLGIPLSEKNPFVKIDDTWYYDTGDLGYFAEDGALHLAGRLKRFVKIAGEMVSLVALEAALKERQIEGTKPWADSEVGPVIAVEAFEPDGEKPVLALVTAVQAELDEANEQLRAAGMPKIAKLTVKVEVHSTFESRWADQGTLPLLGTGKTDYASVKRAVADAVQAARSS